MPLPLYKGGLRCPRCGSEELARHKRAEHLIQCETCHQRYTGEAIDAMKKEEEDAKTPDDPS